MTATAAIGLILDRHPDLLPDAVPVYLMLCAHDALTVPGLARRLAAAQSTITRHLALLTESGLVESKAGGQATRWSLTSAGQKLAAEIALA
jgi:DNA-binding MarR family transcriptional regulator